ncbi:MAG: hypothetical protein ACWGMZ_05965 [Thermoguttaceae bacterium]
MSMIPGPLALLDSAQPFNEAMNLTRFSHQKCATACRKASSVKQLKKTLLLRSSATLWWNRIHLLRNAGWRKIAGEIRLRLKTSLPSGRLF